jgi:hypothetical protein
MLVKPAPSRPQARKAWSIDLENTWLPFFHSTNLEGHTKISLEALGAPLRLGYNPDGSVRFSKTGRPIIRIVKDISDNVRLVRENFVAGLQSYAHEVITANTEAYNKQVADAVKAGKPIIDRDSNELVKAMTKAVEQAVNSAESPTETGTETVTQETKELVTVS